MSNKNIKHLLPQKFLERIESFHLPSEINTLVAGLQSRRKVQIRVNTLKSNDREIEEVLRKNQIKFKKFQVLKHCYIIENESEKQIEKLDIYETGKIYFQNISSQVPVHFLDIQKNDTILDVTAAPGSKTTQICALLENTGSVTANEIDAIRFERLKYNIDHLGCKNVTIINNDARKLGNKTSPLAPLLTGEGGKGIFDKILADLPCSAEGRIFLKNQKSFGYWSEKNIEKHAKLQKQILSSVIPLLKSGGILVYSTCTIAPEENEAIVNWMIQNFDLDVIPIDMEYKYLKKGITEFQGETYHPSCKNTIRCIPSDETEGFYIAKLRKK